MGRKLYPSNPKAPPPKQELPIITSDIAAENQRLRAKVERVMDAEFAHDWRTWPDEPARLLLGVGPRLDAFLDIRAALTGEGS